MKKIIFVIFVVLQTGYLVNAQNDRTFYQVCYNKDAQSYVDFDRDEIIVKILNNDSIIFESVGRAYSAQKVADFNFLEGGKDVYHFYAYKVDDNSFIIYTTFSEGFSYYHADKRKLVETDENKRCVINDLKQFGSFVKSYKEKEKEVGELRKKEFEAQTKDVITEYMKNYKSKKVDLTLEKGIVKWWNNSTNPILRIYFINPSYDFPRNNLGIVLRKTVNAYYIYKWSDGKCYMQWRSFGYESLGGGAFNDEVNSWIPGDTYSNLPGNREIPPGKNYEVDCAAFQK